MQKREKETSTIFDDVFRTMVEKMPYLFIPLINEVFCQQFALDEPINLLKNEHMTPNGKKVTDSCFLIENKRYHIECQCRPDGVIALRMLEYDIAIALEQAWQEGEKYRVKFPHSCVLYLRPNHDKRLKEEIYVEFANGEEHIYEVPIIDVQAYTKEEIFKKNLLVLLPYYIMKYEKQLAKESLENHELQMLFQDFREIKRNLEDLGSEGKNEIYADLAHLILHVSNYMLKKTAVAGKGIGEIMGGEVLELYSEKLIKEGRAEGELRTVISFVKEGIISVEYAAAKLAMTTEEFEKMAKEMEESI